MTTESEVEGEKEKRAYTQKHMTINSEKWWDETETCACVYARMSFTCKQKLDFHIWVHDEYAAKSQYNDIMVLVSASKEIILIKYTICLLSDVFFSPGLSFNFP